MRTPIKVTLRELQINHLDEAAQVVTYSMRYNPAIVRAFRIEDAALRTRSRERFFRPVLSGLHERGVIIGAFCDSALVGACSVARPGSCQPTLLEKIELLPSLVSGNPMGTAIRVVRWAGEWARRDPTRPHWHLGPVAVSPHIQGQGIGCAMLSALL